MIVAPYRPKTYTAPHPLQPIIRPLPAPATALRLDPEGVRVDCIRLRKVTGTGNRVPVPLDACYFFALLALVYVDPCFVAVSYLKPWVTPVWWLV